MNSPIAVNLILYCNNEMYCDTVNYLEKSLEKLFIDKITRQECPFWANLANEVPVKSMYFITLMQQSYKKPINPVSHKVALLIELQHVQREIQERIS